MPKALIKLAYMQVIDAASESYFEKMALKLSYDEYLLKSQAYNSEGKYKSFSSLKAADGRANSLHYKCGFAVSGLLETLNKKIPGLQNNSGQSIVFDVYRFEVLESDITDQSKHKIVIHYTTDTLTLLASFADQLLVAYGDKSSDSQAGVVEDTFLLPLQPGINIVSYGAL
ncbi:MAG: hypothetical protein V4722_19030 [Bacteroidota bacterium]